jgi:hypothetical protein
METPTAWGGSPVIVSMGARAEASGGCGVCCGSISAEGKASSETTGTDVVGLSGTVIVVLISGTCAFGVSGLSILAVGVRIDCTGFVAEALICGVSDESSSVSGSPFNVPTERSAKLAPKLASVAAAPPAISTGSGRNPTAIIAPVKTTARDIAISLARGEDGII